MRRKLSRRSFGAATGGSAVAAANGLETILKGIKAKARNDDELAQHAMKVLDHFYSGYAQDGDA